MRLLAVAAVLALALAGCSGSKTESSSSGTDTATGSTTGSPTGTAGGSTAGSTSSGSVKPSSTGNSGTAANRAPAIAGFFANVTSGVAPLAVKFIFNATDADKDNLTYTLTFGVAKANATGKLVKGLGNATYTYAAAGTYNATLKVSDGRLSANKTMAVTVTAPPTTGPAEPIQHETVEWMAAASGCLAEYPAITPLEETGNIAYGQVTVPAATIGHAFTAIVSWTVGPLALGADVSFYDGDGQFVDGILVDGTSPIAIEGTVPAGAAFAVFTLCDAVNGASADYTVV